MYEVNYIRNVSRQQKFKTKQLMKKTLLINASFHIYKELCRIIFLKGLQYFHTNQYLKPLQEKQFRRGTSCAQVYCAKLSLVITTGIIYSLELAEYIEGIILKQILKSPVTGVVHSKIWKDWDLVFFKTTSTSNNCAYKEIQHKFNRLSYKSSTLNQNILLPLSIFNFIFS